MIIADGAKIIFYDKKTVVSLKFLGYKYFAETFTGNKIRIS